LIENVSLVCSALKIIRWSKSASVSAEHLNSQVEKSFCRKKLKSDKKKLNKKLSRKEKKMLKM
jgi:hypothetical protein